MSEEQQRWIGTCEGCDARVEINVLPDEDRALEWSSKCPYCDNGNAMVFVSGGSLRSVSPPPSEPPDKPMCACGYRLTHDSVARGVSYWRCSHCGNPYWFKVASAPPAPEAAPPQPEILARIQEYLGNGGFFNPEMMDHAKARELLIDVRAALASPSPKPESPPSEPRPALDALIANWRREASRPQDSGSRDECYGRACAVKTNCADELEQALSAVTPPEWPDISTVPDDLDRILTIDNGRVVTAKRGTNGMKQRGWFSEGPVSWQVHPIAWMPLPALPPAEKEQ